MVTESSCSRLRVKVWCGAVETTECRYEHELPDSASTVVLSRRPEQAPAVGWNLEKEGDVKQMLDPVAGLAVGGRRRCREVSSFPAVTG